MPAANNVTRMLDAQHIPYRACAVPEKKLTAVEVAAYLKIPAEKVYKTIVFERFQKGKAILAIVPATAEVDSRKLANAVGEKKVSVTTLEKAETLTGLRAGGISPLALIHKGFQTILDKRALGNEEIIISGGQWGLQIAISPKDLAKLTNAHCADISR